MGLRSMTDEGRKCLKQLFKLARGEICPEVYLPEFKTKPLDTEVAKECVRIIGNFNDFEPDLVCSIMDKFRGKVESYQIGMEGSPVIYVNLPYYTYQREYSKEQGRRINREFFERLRADVMLEWRKALPNELDFDELIDHEIRIWWD